MFNWLLVAVLVGVSFIIGFAFASKDRSNNSMNNAHLNKLDNTDISCGKAFESLEISNAWGKGAK